MSRIRVLVGTKKGAFILTSDGKREKWDVSGPHFAGWEMYHLKGSPVDPNRIYASQTSGWFGQIIQRSDDGGKDVECRSEQQVRLRRRRPGTHQWYDGTQHPWEFKRVWHLEPSLTDPDTVYAGVEDAAIFKTTDGGKTWNELPGLRSTAQGRNGSRARAAWACTRSCSIRTIPSASTSPSPPRARFAPTTAAQTWKPINRGLKSQYIPDPDAEVGHCVHRIAMHPSRPNVLFMQKHWDVHAHRQRRRAVARSQRQSADRFRLSDRRSRARAGDDLRRADQERLASIFRRTASCASIAAGPAATNGKRSPKACRRGLLRQRPARRDGGRFARSTAASISARPAGRSTCSPDGGDTWNADRARSAGGAFGRSADAAYEDHDPRGLLPYHLRNLARQISGEVRAGR